MAEAATRPPSSPGVRLALLAFAQFIITLDFNIVYVALPDIGSDLGFTVQSLQWVVSAYIVALGGLLLFGGRAADRLGARRMFMVGLAIYAVSSLTGGLAGDSGVLLAARAVQGIGGALLFPATLRLVFTSFEEGPMRNKALVVYGAIGGAGLSAGALLGGILTNYSGWEWVFFVNVPLALAAAALAPRILPADTFFPGANKGFDVLGALVATVGATLVVFGLASGPDAGWLSLRGAGAIVSGVVLLALFLLIESRADSPLMPLRLLRHRSLAVTMVVAFIYQGGLGGAYYLFTTYLQDVLHYSPLSAGFAFLPPTFASMAFAAKFSTKLLTKLGLRGTLFAGTLCTGVGMGAFAVAFSADGTGSYWVLLPGLILWSVGGALAIPAIFAGAGAGVALLEQGVSSAMATTARQIGGAVGLAALVAVANARIHVPAHGVPPLSDLTDGLRVAGLVGAGVTVLGSFLALLHHRPAPAAKPAAEPATATDEAAVSS
ncbi:drug resistance transporter, EmrB/QacA subfamily [Streptomyces sp. DvalAA-14]|uniref:MFS transporter n=1 Tax=unclassified Streptomyces TaxID=2593676 RepID=UPI00081B8A04|nr:MULTISPECIES: MFS transporter [unclassified Streptomyces]MYS24420.1 MFS transporter [Streptomyces sp. SID4948]SCE45853.1 drug resistance transporter, EmrB/QacA subfamily [Streptomyces sp. DvalAA-14]